MYVSLETLQRAVSLVDSLAELDDPDGFAAIVLPGLAGLVGCDVITDNDVGPAEHQIALALIRADRDFSGRDRALLHVLRAPLIAALARARSRQQAGQAPAAAAAGGLLDSPGSPGSPGLTDRETTILRLVATGRTNSAIAHQLQLSPRTVAKHLEHVYRKLGVSSRAAAVARLTIGGPAGS
jgi:DNA-binding CsgD family transcriptional regulator